MTIKTLQMQTGRCFIQMCTIANVFVVGNDIMEVSLWRCTHHKNDQQQKSYSFSYRLLLFQFIATLIDINNEFIVVYHSYYHNPANCIRATKVANAAYISF